MVLFTRTSQPLADIETLDAPVQPARYRSTRTGQGHAYRGALAGALLMAGATALTWFAHREALESAGAALLWITEHNTERGRALATVLFASVALLSLVAAWGRASAPGRPVRLADGRGTMAVESIAGRLEAEIARHPDVRSAEVSVANRHWRGVRVTARLRVTSQARLEEVIAAFQADAEWLLHDRIGMPMERRPQVLVEYDELDLRAGRVHG